MRKLALFLLLLSQSAHAGSFTPTNAQIMRGSYAFDDSIVASNRLVNGGIYTGQTASIGGLQCSATVSNWIEMPDVFVGATAVTISAWIRRGPSSEMASIIRKGDNGGRDVSLRVSLADTVYFTAANGVDSYGTCTLAGNAWHFYAMVYNGGAGTIVGYIDGVQQSLSLVGTPPASIGTSNYRTSIVIGAFDYASYDSQGYYRNVLISTNTITSNQQYQLYIDTSLATYNTAWATNVPNAWVALSLSKYWDSNAVVTANADMNREAAILWWRAVNP